MGTQKIYFRNETGMEQIFYNTVLNSIVVKPGETYILDPNELTIRATCGFDAPSWIAAALRTKLREL